MCEKGYDELFEKERQFMAPLEEGPFYARAASTLARTAPWVASSSTTTWRS